MRWIDALGIALSLLEILRRQVNKAREARRKAQQTRSGAMKPPDRCLVDICWPPRYVGAYCLEHAVAKPVSLWPDH
jgi:hypothetical protein